MSPFLAALTAVNDASIIIGSLMPLIQDHASGVKEVTEEDMRAALATTPAALKMLDELIAKKGG